MRELARRDARRARERRRLGLDPRRLAADRRRRARSQAALSPTRPTRPSPSCRSPRRSRPARPSRSTSSSPTQLPEVFARTGYKGDFHMVGQWFPKIGVRVGPPGAERWECQPFHANTEFFADFGVYDVTLTVPTTHAVAATGVLTAVERVAGRHAHVHVSRRGRPRLRVDGRPVHEDDARGTAKRRRTAPSRSASCLPARADATSRARHLEAGDRRDREVLARVRAVSVVDHDGHRSAGRRGGRRGRHGVPDAGHDRRRLGVRAPGHAPARVRHRPRGRPQLVPGHARVERGRRGVDGRGRQRVGRRAR